jgi:predicted site-specific integrase-resolvase
MSTHFKRPYRIYAAARKVGVCEETMRRWVRAGYVYAIKAGNVILIPQSEVARLSGTRETVPDYKALAAADTE